MRTLFIMPSSGVSTGRNHIHVNLWKDLGHTADVAAFCRTNESDIYHVDVALGKVTHGRYFMRIPAYVLAAIKLIRILRSYDNAIVYTLDNFYLLKISEILSFRKVYTVLFILDIRDVLLKRGKIGGLYRQLFKQALRASDVVAVSSKNFIEDFARIYLKENVPNWIEIENKISPKIVSKPSIYSRGLVKEPITIGYFGIIRCSRSIEVLYALMRSAPDKFRLILYGSLLGVESSVQGLLALPNTEFRGAYHGVNDLERVYQSCDMVWACYPFSSQKSGNFLWARTNRYYESFYFRKPMVVSRDTQDALNVYRFGIGIELDLRDVDNAVRSLLAIDAALVNSWISAYEKLPREMVIYNDEFKRLEDMIKSGES